MRKVISAIVVFGMCLFCGCNNSSSTASNQPQEFIKENQLAELKDLYNIPIDARNYIELQESVEMIVEKGNLVEKRFRNHKAGNLFLLSVCVIAMEVDGTIDNIINSGPDDPIRKGSLDETAYSAYKKCLEENNPRFLQLMHGKSPNEIMLYAKRITDRVKRATGNQ